MNLGKENEVLKTNFELVSNYGRSNAKIPKKSKKTPNALEQIYLGVLGRMKKRLIVHSTAELGVKHGLYTEQAVELYKRIEHFRKTNEHLVPLLTKYENIEVKEKSKKNKKGRVKVEKPVDNIDFLQTHLVRIREKLSLEKVESMRVQTELKEGFIYVITNPAYIGWYKIGMTVDYEERLNTYNTGDPSRSYKIEAVRWVEDRRTAEATMLETLKKMSIQYKGEWVKMDEALLFAKFYELTI